MNNAWPGRPEADPSVGYHGHDGMIGETVDKYHKVQSFKDGFAAGITVGCGIDWDVGAYYFTRQGKRVGKSLDIHVLILQQNKRFKANRKHSALSESNHLSKTIPADYHISASRMYIQGQLWRGPRDSFYIPS